MPVAQGFAAKHHVFDYHCLRISKCRIENSNFFPNTAGVAIILTANAGLMLILLPPTLEVYE
ncbi:MAG TPA: hypothetical protein DEP36_12810 [Gammaproteobacteria bacterium]|nr:hypothetical protein [Gammaproteobacteria bacterium]